MTGPAPQPAPSWPCPVDGCTFTAPLDLPPRERSTVITDAAPARVKAVLAEHGATVHDRYEFEAACLVVAAGLR